MPHCPRCQAEYEESVEVCADCLEQRDERVTLVSGPPRIEAQTARRSRMIRLMRRSQSRSTSVSVLWVIAGVLFVFGIIGFIGNAASIYQFGNQRSVLGAVGDLCQALVYALEPAALTFGLAIIAGCLADILDGLHVARLNETDSPDAA